MEPKQKTSRFRMMIEDILPVLGVQEGKIARWMLSNEKELINTPIKAIADACSVSQPTVVRFCKKLGCTGTKDLKVLLNSIVSDDQTSLPCSFDNSEKEIFKKVFSSSLSSIEKSFSETNCDEISELSLMLISSRSIYIYGIGGSEIVAFHLYNGLKRLGLNAYFSSTPLSSFDSHKIRKDDLVFFVSREGENKALIEIARKAKDKGAFIFTLTTNDSSSLYTLSDRAIKTSENQYLENDKNSYSRVGEIAIVETIYLMCAKKLGTKDPSFKENYLSITNYK